MFVFIVVKFILLSILQFLQRFCKLFFKVEKSFRKQSAAGLPQELSSRSLDVQSSITPESQKPAAAPLSSPLGRLLQAVPGQAGSALFLWYQELPEFNRKEST